MKRLILFLFLFLPAAAIGDTLIKGAVYYDSSATFAEATAFRLLKEIASLDNMIKMGHISDPTEEARIVTVYVIGEGPNDPAEFSFPNDPTTYWTATKNLEQISQPQPQATPVPSPTPHQKERLVHHRTKEDKEEEEDAYYGRTRIWHTVDGHRKWYYAKPKDVRKAIPVESSAAQR